MSESTGALPRDGFLVRLNNRIEVLSDLLAPLSETSTCGSDSRCKVKCSVTFKVKSFMPPGPALSRASARNMGIEAAMMVTAVSATERMVS